jgi:hypothetical protein
VIEGACHCGIVTWSFSGTPETATACNCTVCRRYGVLWVYDYENEDIVVVGPTQAYIPDGSLGFHFCQRCGCVAYWRCLELDANGRRPIAVNLRLSAPESVSNIAIRHFDGLASFDELPSDGRCVNDYWS